MGAGVLVGCFHCLTAAKFKTCTYRSREGREEQISSLGAVNSLWFEENHCSFGPLAKVESFGTVFALKLGESQTGKSNNRSG